MLVAVADTHGIDGHRLEGRAAAAVAEATTVLHAGDFTTERVYEAIEAVSAPASLHAVYGNRDDAVLRERLPAVATVDALEKRFVLVHGHAHDPTSLSLLARQEGADCVVVGHTHRSGIEELGGVPLLNPGSHADPRGGPATHGEIRREDGGVTVEIVTVAGSRRAIGQV